MLVRELGIMGDDETSSGSPHMVCPFQGRDTALAQQKDSDLGLCELGSLSPSTCHQSVLSTVPTLSQMAILILVS